MLTFVVPQRDKFRALTIHLVFPVPLPAGRLAHSFTTSRSLLSVIPQGMATLFLNPSTLQALFSTALMP